MKKLWKGLLLSAGTVAAASAGGTAYFYRRTMKRYHAKTERTMKMSGTDWSQYMPLMEERKANMHFAGWRRRNMFEQLVEIICNKETMILLLIRNSFARLCLLPEQPERVKA